MGRNSSNNALNPPTMEAVFHFRSASNLSTKSEDTVTSASAARKGVRSVAEFASVSSSVEDVSYARRDSPPRHAFCSSRLATTERSASYSQQNKLKLAILGDSGVGKTSLLMSLTTDKVPDTHAPTIYDKFSGELVCMLLTVVCATSTGCVRDYSRFEVYGVNICLLVVLSLQYPKQCMARECQ